MFGDVLQCEDIDDLDHQDHLVDNAAIGATGDVSVLTLKSAPDLWGPPSPATRDGTPRSSTTTVTSVALSDAASESFTLPPATFASASSPNPSPKSPMPPPRPRDSSAAPPRRRSAGGGGRGFGGGGGGVKLEEDSDSSRETASIASTSSHSSSVGPNDASSPEGSGHPTASFPVALPYPRRPSGEGPRRAGTFSKLFGGGGAPVDAPPDAILQGRAVSFFGGVVGDPRSCKIYGKALVWATKTTLVVKGLSGAGSTMTWPLKSIEICRKAETFDHGEFVISAEGRLGWLLEIQGRCAPSGNDDSPLAKASFVAGAHIAIRGLEECDKFVELAMRSR